MRSPALAIAWEFRERHRWGVIGLVVYLVTLVAIKFGVGKASLTIDDEVRFALMVVVPMSAVFMYFLAVFTFGVGGDVAARKSMYPARMFTLPMTTGALAFWPMLYGSIAMAVLWGVARLFGVWPSNVDVPTFWPLLLGPALLAWTQALTWMPYPLPGLRVAVTVVWLTVIDAVIMIALELKASEPVMMAILAPQVPLAYLVARFAVTRARRGHEPDWSGLFAWTAAARRLEHFRSAARAQGWLEWRQFGRVLPWWVAILMPFELWMLFVFNETPVLIAEVLVWALLTAPFMACFVAPNVSRSGPFVDTRPVSNTSLIAAKLKVTIGSTLAAWLVVVVAIPIAVWWSGSSPIVMGWARRTVEIFGVPRAIVLALLVLAMLVGATWKQLVQSLYVGMSGREWALKASVFVPLAILTVAMPLGHWVITSPQRILVVASQLPWVAAVLVCIKLSMAARIAIRLDGIVSDRVLIAGAALWCVTVFALCGVLAWLVGIHLIRGYFLALLSILVVPLVRLGSAPVALARSRHR